MATPSPPNSSALLFVLLVPLLLASAVSAHDYRVGGPSGWTKPASNESETYDHWAKRHRFHVGDSLYFKYENDSVLVVDRDDYLRCNTTSPVQRFTDGNTTFSFDRYGFFCFISGEPGHCKAGEKLLVRVMVHSEFVTASPGPAPYPHPGGGGSPGGPRAGPSGSKKSSGTLKVNGGYSVVMAGVVGMLIALMFV